MKKLFFLLILFFAAKYALAQKNITLEVAEHPGSSYCYDSEKNDYQNSLFICLKGLKNLGLTALSIGQLDSIRADVVVDISNTNGLLNTVYPRRSHVGYRNMEHYFGLGYCYNYKYRENSQKKISLSIRHEKDIFDDFPLYLDSLNDSVRTRYINYLTERLVNTYYLAIVFDKCPSQGTIKVSFSNIRIYRTIEIGSIKKDSVFVQDSALLDIPLTFSDKELEAYMDTANTFPRKANDVILPEVLITSTEDFDGNILLDGLVVLRNASRVKKFSLSFNCQKSYYNGMIAGGGLAEVGPIIINDSGIDSKITFSNNSKSDYLESFLIEGNVNLDKRDSISLFRFFIKSKKKTYGFINDIILYDDYSRKILPLIDRVSFSFMGGRYCLYNKYILELLKKD